MTQYWSDMMHHPEKLIEQQVSYWGKTLKHFEVIVGGDSAPADAPAAAPASTAQPAATAPAGVDPAALAALQNLSDEEKKALGLLAG